MLVILFIYQTNIVLAHLFHFILSYDNKENIEMNDNIIYN